jgi:hypothetical protein
VPQDALAFPVVATDFDALFNSAEDEEGLEVRAGRKRCWAARGGHTGGGVSWQATPSLTARSELFLFVRRQTIESI